AFALGTASLTGMLTGVLLALLAIVLGDYGWFALLITFFGLGGLSSKYRYEEKRARGIAEANEGARGSGNVLANSAVALVAVVFFAASGRVGVPPELFRFAFAGSVATAMADTLSSEIGGLFDEPRLITTFERVEPGTDGAVTWQGELAGVVGAAVIGGIAALFFNLGPVATAVVVAGGFAGTLADSLLGATLEGPLLGNQGVNLLATLAGAVVSAALALALGFT
ncbi:MAG: TIGR00297 family protein, partial [Haloglomus sp.]